MPFSFSEPINLKFKTVVNKKDAIKFMRGPIEDRFPLEINPVVLNMHSTGTEAALMSR
jgi:hypothetical protein